MLVLNQVKPQAVARLALGAGTGVHSAKPWQWWPVIELGAGADAGAGAGAGADAGAQPGQAQALGAGAQSGKVLAVIWPALGAGTGVHPASPGRGSR